MKHSRLYQVLIVVALVAQVRAQDPFHRAYTTADGLPSDQVYCALQDREGYVWFGTDAGVSRFDGVEFVNYGPADGLTDNEVIVIYQDRSDRIWFLTLNGRLCFWEHGQIHGPTKENRIGEHVASSGWCLAAEDKKGRIWFSGVRGEAWRYDPMGHGDIFFKRDLASRTVVIDTSGEAIVISNGQEDFGSEGPSALDARGLRALSCYVHQPRDRHFAPLMLCADGIREMSATRTTMLAGTEGLVDERVHRTVVKDVHGDLWLYRKDKGVDHLAPSMGGFKPAVRQFGSIGVNTVEVTDDGNAWYCTANHGVMLVDHQVNSGTAWYPNDRNSGATFMSIARAHDRVWVGTDLGSIMALHNGHLEELFRPSEGRLPGRILRIVVSPQGRAWFASDWGLFTWSSSKPEELPLLPVEVLDRGELEYIASPAKTVMVARNGIVWSPGIGLFRHDADDAVRRRVMEKAVGYDRINSIAQDASERIWFAQGSHLRVLQADVIRTFELPGSFQGVRVSDIVHLGGDTLAIATAGHGVLLWHEGESVGMISPLDGLVTGMVRRMHRAGDTLWCATSTGASAFKLSHGKVVDSWSWTEREGLPNGNVYDISTDGPTVYLGTAAGLCTAPLRPLRVGRAPLRLVLTGIHVQDTLVRLAAGPLRVDTRDRIRIDVHALEFALAGKVEYAYQLGRKEEWSPCERGQVIIDGCDEGDQVVRVKARLPGGEWCPSFEVRFSARAPWWASRLSRIAAAMGILSLLLMVLYYWSRRSLRRQLERARAVAVINEERRRIAADVHDDLGADLSRVLMHARRLEATAGMLDEGPVSGSIVSTIDKIDEIIWSLDPRRDTLQGTVHFIEQQARELAEANDLKYRTLVELPQVDIPLAANARREMMLIAREAMRNIVEHAHATTLRIEWRSAQDSLRMIIEDDGAGIDLSIHHGERHGILNMHQRALAIGGTLTIGQVQPHGTRVELAITFGTNHPIG